MTTVLSAVSIDQTTFNPYSIQALVFNDGQKSWSNFFKPEWLSGSFEGRQVLYTGSHGGWAEGSHRAELLIGGMGNDHISGGGGNDIIFSGMGSDALDGGSGNDLIY